MTEKRGLLYNGRKNDEKRSEAVQKILLLEDDRNLNQGISLKLKKEGYEVYSAFMVKEAETLFDAARPDLIISDVNLPDKSGLDFCAEIRKKSNAFIIFLTALDSEIDMVNGYDLGADDYVTKPFSLMVLVSKVHAFMRRAGSSPKNWICSGYLRVSYAEMKAYRGEEQISLSRKEFRLLLYLMENARQILSKEQILEHVWDVDGQFVDENTVPVNISRLKAKIGEGYIQNVRGMGYIWIEECVKE